MKPLVSIVIPHFNRSVLLASTLKSIDRNAVSAHEVIVVDDGSSARERSAVAPFESDRVRIVDRNGGIKGPSRCRNIGLAESKADLIIFLDSDDLLAPWCLSQRLASISHDSAADFHVFPVMLFKSQPGDQDMLWNDLDCGLDPAERFAKSDPPWHTSSPIWKKSSLAKIGGFNERVFYGDDSDLHLRALVSGIVPRIELNTLPDVFVRRGNESRVTNSLSKELIASRLVRLREGAAFLNARSGVRKLKAWFEGQYFSEAEFLLFNAAAFPGSIDSVLDAWQEDCRPAPVKRFIVHQYIRIAVASRDNAYFILRAARKAARSLLPPEYFPAGGLFESAHLGEPQLSMVRKKLTEAGYPE